jgi:MFS family permease
MAVTRRSADGTVRVLDACSPDVEQLLARFPSGDVPAARDASGAVVCTPPPSARPAAFTVVGKTGEGLVTLGSGVLEGDGPVHRGAGGLTRCTPGGVCPPGAEGLRCRFPGGDAPGARRDADGAVVCTPAASSAARPFTVTAGEVALGDGVLAPSVTGMRAFAAISTCYLLFTTTDGALRMIVLFHAFNQGFTAWQVALMFGLYELAGVATNLLAGVAGARWGVRPTLLVGLSIQLVGIAMLFGFDIAWPEPDSRWKALAWVAFANGVGGVAKDLVKLGGKTVSKLVTPEEKQSQLFAIVAWITGMKNSMKGVGYFIGAASLSVSLGFALALNAALILIALPIALLGLPADVGRARSKNLSLRTILSPAPNIQRLSLARAFLFGSRDLWFEVALPFFLRDAQSGLGWSRTVSGASLAAFIIVYGQIQSATPRALLRPLAQEPANKLVQVLWNSVLTAVCVALTLAFTASDVFTARREPAMTGVLWVLLSAFCVVFAANSSIHSYLIVRYSGGDKVAGDVGFYYMSNAAGRFVGTLVSGALYEWSAGSDKAAALGWCFLASALFSLASTLLTLRIDDQQAGLLCGRHTVVAAGAADAQSERQHGGGAHPSRVQPEALPQAPGAGGG